MFKKETNQPQKTNFYFWRTYDQKEVDVVAEKNNQITAYEIKLASPKRTKGLSAFSKAYPQSITKVITRANFTEEL